MLSARKLHLVAGLKVQGLDLRQAEVDFYMLRYVTVAGLSSMMTGMAYIGLIKIKIPEVMQEKRNEFVWQVFVFYTSTSAMMALSLVNLAKAWLTAWLASRELGLSLGVYLNLLLQMFKGLPLEALRSNATDVCTLADMRLTPDLVGVLAKVLRDYNTTLETLDLADCVALPTGRAEDERRAADAFKELAEFTCECECEREQPV